MANYDDFEEAVAFTLSWEGAYSNDPSDRGGETKFGIAGRSHPDLRISELSIGDAREIYRRDYWPTCESLPMPLAYCVFDAAVHHGPTRAKRFLERSGGDWAAYNHIRLDHFVKVTDKDQGQRKFLRGWVRRIVALNWLCMRWLEEHGEA